jgi:hypothetical protein
MQAYEVSNGIICSLQLHYSRLLCLFHSRFFTVPHLLLQIIPIQIDDNNSSPSILFHFSAAARDWIVIVA